MTYQQSSSVRSSLLDEATVECQEVTRANIERAPARRDAALAEYEVATGELAWWRDGQVPAPSRTSARLAADRQ